MAVALAVASVSAENLRSTAPSHVPQTISRTLQSWLCTFVLSPPQLAAPQVTFGNFGSLRFGRFVRQGAYQNSRIGLKDQRFQLQASGNGQSDLHTCVSGSV